MRIAARRQTIVTIALRLLCSNGIVAAAAAAVAGAVGAAVAAAALVVREAELSPGDC